MEWHPPQHGNAGSDLPRYLSLYDNILRKLHLVSNFVAMSGLLPFVLLGTLILILGARLALLASSARTQRRSVTIEEFANAREALDTAIVETAAIGRIFSSEDIEFISRSSTRKVQQLFLRERKALAMQWLRKTQKEVAQFMDLHLRLAAYPHEPGPKFELKLAGKYVAFIVVSYLLLLLVWLRGPFKARRVVGYTCAVAGYLCSICSMRLERVADPAPRS
jgi:hypothetical protein